MDQILRDNSATYFERVNMVFQLPCQIAATVGHYEIIQKSEECHNCRLEHRLSSESSRSWAILVSVTLLLKSLWRWRWWVIWLVGLVFLSAWFIILPANRMYGNFDESCVYIYIQAYINQTLGQNSAASSLGFPIFVLQKSSSLFPTCQIRFETLWDARPKSTTPRRVAGFWWVEVVSVLGFPKNSFLCLKDTYG